MPPPPPPPPVPYHPGYWPAPYYPGYWGAPAVVAGAVAGAATAVAIGSMVYALPETCTKIVVNNVAYEQCDASWFRPQYSGNRIAYVAVPPP